MRLTHSLVYRQGYFDGWITAYDELITILERQGIDTSELDRIDAWVENELDAWLKKPLPGEPPTLEGKARI